MTSMDEYNRRMRSQQKAQEEKDRNEAYNEFDSVLRKQHYWHGKHVHAMGAKNMEPHPGPQEGWEEVSPGRYRLRVRSD